MVVALGADDTNDHLDLFSSVDMMTKYKQPFAAASMC
jgi:hypothetical protein